MRMASSYRPSTTLRLWLATFFIGLFTGIACWANPLTPWSLVYCEEAAAGTSLVEAGRAADRLALRLERRAATTIIRNLAARLNGSHPPQDAPRTEFSVTLIGDHVLGMGSVRVKVSLGEAGRLLLSVYSTDYQLEFARALSTAEFMQAFPGGSITLDPLMTDWVLVNNWPGEWLLAARRLRVASSPDLAILRSPFDRPRFEGIYLGDYIGGSEHVSWASSYMKTFVDRTPALFRPLGFRFSPTNDPLAWRPGDRILIPGALLEGRYIPPGDHHRITLISFDEANGLIGYCENYRWLVKARASRIRDFLTRNLVGYYPREANWEERVQALGARFARAIAQDPAGFRELRQADPNFLDEFHRRALGGFTEWIPPAFWLQAGANANWRERLNLQHGDLLFFIGRRDRPANNPPYHQRSYSEQDQPLWRYAMLLEEAEVGRFYPPLSRPRNAFEPEFPGLSGQSNSPRYFINPQHSNRGYGSRIDFWVNRFALELHDIVPGSLFIRRGARSQAIDQ